MSCADGRWNPQHLVAGSEIAFIRRMDGLSRNHHGEFEDRATCIDGNSDPTRVSESQKFWRMELGRGCFWRRATPAVHRVGLRGANGLENTYESVILDPPGQHIPCIQLSLRGAAAVCSTTRRPGEIFRLSSVPELRLCSGCLLRSLRCRVRQKSRHRACPGGSLACAL